MLSWIKELSLSDTYSWLVFAEIWVLVGVVLEAVPDVIKFVREVIWRGGWISAIHKTFHHWGDLITLIGGIIVAFGIFGEIELSASAQEKSDKQIQSQKDKTAQIEKSAAPRDVAAPKKYGLQFTASRTRPIVMVISYVGDAEAGRLANEIIHQLTAITFSPIDNSLSFLPAPPMAFGIYVSGPNSDLVNMIVSWLNESNLRAIIHAEPPLRAMFMSAPAISPPGAASLTADAIVFVGAKPLPN
jgi:hypothetical protein